MNTQLRSLSHFRRIMGGTYADKILATGPIAYWPLDEPAGTVAACPINAAMNGTATGVTWANDLTGPFNTPAPLFDGTNDFISIYSAALAAAFDGDLGSLMIWARVYNVGVWSDGTVRNTAYLRYDSSNYMYMQNPVNNRFQWRRRATAVDSGVTYDPISDTNWMHLAQTWDQAGDAFKAYFNGAQYLLTQTGLATWFGTLSNTVTTIGASSTAPGQPWYGWLAHCAVWDRVLAPAEVQALANP